LKEVQIMNRKKTIIPLAAGILTGALLTTTTDFSLAYLLQR